MVLLTVYVHAGASRLQPKQLNPRAKDAGGNSRLWQRAGQGREAAARPGYLPPLLGVRGTRWQARYTCLYWSRVFCQRFSGV